MSDSKLPSSINLISSACLDIFSSNSRTLFINLLHAELSKRTWQENVWVRLHSIGISTISEEPSQAIKVHLSEVAEQRHNNETDKSIGAFFYPSNSKSNGYLHYTFENSVYLPLRLSKFQTFQIKLTNANNYELNIPTGGETVVTLQVTDDIMLTRDSFTISCSSFHPRMYPGNTSSNFTSPLFKEMNLNGEYEVALHNIVYPAGLYEETRVWIKLNDVEFAYLLSEFEDTDDFVEEVSLDIRQSKFGSEVKFEKGKHGASKGRAIISRLEEVIDNNLPEGVRIQMSPEFSAACGLMGRSLHDQVLKRGEAIVLLGLLDINNATPNPVAVLESNIVGSSLIGSRKANILQCVPVLSEKNSVDQSTMFISQKLFFQPVDRRPVDSLMFKFTNPDGSRRVFYCRNPRHEMLITLVFRRRVTY